MLKKIQITIGIILFVLTVNGELIAQNLRWSRPTTLSTNGDFSLNGRSAVSPLGNRVVAAWHNIVRDKKELRVKTGVINKGIVTWDSNYTAINNVVETTPELSINPVIALSADGSKLSIVWQEYLKTNSSINYIAVRSAVLVNGSYQWGDSSYFGNTGTQRTALEDLKISEDGTKLALLMRTYEGSSPSIRKLASTFATLSGAQQNWGPLYFLADFHPVIASNPKFAFVANGTKALYVWDLPIQNSNYATIHARVATITGNTATLGGASALSSGSDYSTLPYIAASEDGSKAIIAWGSTPSFTSPADGPRVIYSKLGIVSGTNANWSELTTVPTNYASSSVQGISMSSNGTKAVIGVHALYSTTGKYLDNYAYRASQAFVGTLVNSNMEWSAPILYSKSDEDTIRPTIHITPNGKNVVAMWSQSIYKDETSFNYPIVMYQQTGRVGSVLGSTITFQDMVRLSIPGHSLTQALVAPAATNSTAIALWTEGRMGEGTFFTNVSLALPALNSAIR